MNFSSSAILLFLTISTTAAQIEWKRCPELASNATNPPFQCANLTVPLDYQDNSSKPLVLNLLRLPAPDQPSRGSILFNPGGPGTSGRNVIYGFGPKIAAITGNKHDIVTWDPRGAGVTMPVSCYANATDRQPVDSYSLNSSDASISAAWKQGQRLASACKTALAETGELFGTAYVARDMVRIIDALGEDGLLRYYGTSYGTVLGQIFAGMFPDKVDKMVIDGVTNLQQYLAAQDIQSLSSTDATWEGFLSACISRPSLCSLAQRSTSLKNLRQQMDDLFDQLQIQPVSLGPAPADQITASVLETGIIGLLYNPANWPTLASGLDTLLSPTTNNTASMLRHFLDSFSANANGPFPDQPNDEVTQVIRCSDTFFRTTNESDVAPIVKDLFAQTERFAGPLANGIAIACPQWPFAAKERFTANNFDAQFKNPMLVIGNVFDPVTSLDGARHANATWKSSTLLVQQGYGHTSLYQPSDCKSRAVAAYFNQGKLPDAETVCLVDTPDFATANETAAANALLFSHK